MKLSCVHKEGSIALLPSYAVPMTDDEVDGFIIAAKKKIVSLAGRSKLVR